MKTYSEIEVSVTNVAAMKEKEVDYANSFKKVCSFTTVEECKWLLSRLKSFDGALDLGEEESIEGYSLNFFKKGIEPQWEDPANITGGSFILSVKHGKTASYIFENLVLFFIMNKFTSATINGIRVDVKKYCVKFSVWTEDIPEMRSNTLIYKELTKAMGFEYSVNFLFKNHMKLVEQLQRPEGMSE